MKLLYILRHGKSSPAPAGGDDHDRALDSRGRAEALAQGRNFAARGWQPAHALVSTARRTRETVACFNKGLAAAGVRAVEAAYESALYLAPAERIVEELALAEDGAASIMVVGHNPGLQDLALFLAGRRQSDARGKLARDFPPGALAVFDLAIEHWHAIAPGKARLAAVIFPRDLD